jgi:hypothetical protein
MFAAAGWALFGGFWFIGIGRIFNALLSIWELPAEQLADSLMDTLTSVSALYAIGFIFFLAACIFGCVWGCSCYACRDYMIEPVPETENCLTRNFNKKTYAVIVWLVGLGLVIGGLATVGNAAGSKLDTTNIDALKITWNAAIVPMMHGCNMAAAGCIVWIAACFLGCFFGCTCGCCCKDDAGEKAQVDQAPTIQDGAYVVGYPGQPQYGAPQYGVPDPYGAPPPQYGAPPQQYGAPPQQYGAPPQ